MYDAQSPHSPLAMTREAGQVPHLSTQTFTQVRNTTLALAAPLSPEDCQVQSMPDASPVKWHLAHTTWFFETFILERFETDYEAYDPHFRILFNSYYNAVGDKHPRPQRGLLSRPSLEQVLAYRRHVDEHMLLALSQHGGRSQEFDGLLELGLNHEQQHQELILMDVKHMLSCNPLQPAYQRLASLGSPGAATPLHWIDVPGGIVSIGHPDGAGFAFDNEGPAHDVLLRPFQVASRLVTEGEFLAFIQDGGYQRPEFWLSLGWDAVSMNRWRAPLYWSEDGDEWTVFTLRGPRSLRPAAPVAHLSYFEADAYARWADARLPVEAEWEHAIRHYNGQAAPPGANLLDTGMLQPLAASPMRTPLAQATGDLWEWTSSSYSAYPGFRPRPGAVGEYNGKFMCNQYVLRGGSFATPASHIRVTYRNFFAPEARWQFSGLRLARDV